MKKKWITFDLDGTLMQNPFVDYVFPEIESTVLEKATSVGKVIDSLVSEHNRRMKENLIVEAYDWDDIVRRYLAQNQIEIEINVEDIVKKHSISPKVYLLEAGIIEALAQLKEQGYHLAVATNGFFKYQSPVLDALGLTEVFDLIITPEEAGYAKPNVKMFESLHEEGEIVAHVGDRIDHDVSLANELGIPSVFIYRKLPESLQRLAPLERCKKETCIQLCQEKWKKETRGEFGSYTETQIPKLVIYSIHELQDCLSSLVY